MQLAVQSFVNNWISSRISYNANPEFDRTSLVSWLSANIIFISTLVSLGKSSSVLTALIETWFWPDASWIPNEALLKVLILHFANVERNMNGVIINGQSPHFRNLSMRRLSFALILFAFFLSGIFECSSHTNNDFINQKLASLTQRCEESKVDKIERRLTVCGTKKQYLY